MIILITGASHTGKTVLAQRLLERYHCPYLSLSVHRPPENGADPQRAHGADAGER